MGDSNPFHLGIIFGREAQGRLRMAVQKLPQALLGVGSLKGGEVPERLIWIYNHVGL